MLNYCDSHCYIVSLVYLRSNKQMDILLYKIKAISIMIVNQIYAKDTFVTDIPSVYREMVHTYHAVKYNSEVDLC